MSELETMDEIQSQQRFKVKGPLVFETVASLVSSLPRDVDHLLIDLGAVTEADSSALTLFLVWQRQAEARKISLTYVNWPENMKLLLDLYNLDEILPS